MSYITKPPPPKEKRGFAGYATFEEMMRENYNKKNYSTSGSAKSKPEKKDSVVTSTTTSEVKNKVNHNIEEIVTEKNKRDNDNGIIDKIIKKILG